MSVSHSEFRSALGQFASGVTVVVTRDAKDRPLGLTVSSFCSVSLDPPLVLVCIDNRSDAHAGFEESGVFGISILAEGQEDVSQRFATGGDDKFKGFEMDHGPARVGLVKGACAQIECAVRASHAAGDHVVYVGEVTRVHVQPGRPLLYHRGSYRTLDPRTETP